jgi:N-acetylglucosaminyldiphosphoundecaprenol N-acetyl-beta-D-mannosaminyltransferase
MDKQKLLNTYVNNVSMNETIQEIERLIAQDKKSYVVPINVDVVIKMEHDSYLREIVDKADLVLVDGKPLIWVSQIYKMPIKQKISGSDLVPLLCETAATKGYSIYILGGKDGVADKAKKKIIQQWSNINIVGTYAPPFGFEKDEKELSEINERIAKAKPDILIVCFGCPKQEKYIYENIRHYNAKVSICAGATVDFLAGNVKRAPKWMSEHGLEWFYRFLQEPRRLFKRYFIDDLKIIRLVLKYKPF